MGIHLEVQLRMYILKINILCLRISSKMSPYKYAMHFEEGVTLASVHIDDLSPGAAGFNENAMPSLI